MTDKITAFLSIAGICLPVVGLIIFIYAQWQIHKIAVCVAHTHQYSPDTFFTNEEWKRIFPECEGLR